MEEWINKIAKPNLKVSGITRLYIKHFDDIERSDIFKYRNRDPDIIVSIDRMLSLTRMIY